MANDIKNLSNLYGHKPYELNLDAVRMVQQKKNKEKENVEKKKKIKSYSVIGLLTALGFTSGIAFGAKLSQNYHMNSFANEIASESELNTYDLFDEASNSKFSILINNTAYLLEQDNLSAQDRIKLQQNLLEIENNLGTVINYADSKVSDLFAATTNGSVKVDRNVLYERTDGPTNKLSISINGIDTYNFFDTINNKKLDSDTLAKLFDNTFELSSIENNQKSHVSKKHIFNLVQAVMKQANSLNNLSISLDENGNIVENQASIEK